MSKTCEDCGCRLREGGMCGNCHEEAYILTYQNEFIEPPLSKEFLDKAEQQIDSLESKKNES